MRKRIIPLLLATVLAFSLLPTIALAGGDAWVREADGTEFNLGQGSHSGDGWDWNIKTEVLTLNGFHGEAINFGYYGKKIVIVDGSNNSLSEGLYLSPGSGGSVTVEGTGTLIIDRISSKTQSGVALEIDEFWGPVSIAASLQLTGGMNVDDNYSLTLEYEEYAGASNARYAGYKGGPGYPVTAEGDRAEYVRIGIAASTGTASTTPTPVPAAATGFTDVAATAYYAAPVAWAVEQGITSGKTATTFVPGETCSQAQIITFLWRSQGQPEPKGTVELRGFDGTEYYYKAAQWATEQDMVGGEFNPDAPCTRAMAVSYMWKQAGSPSAVASSFTDVSASADYAQAVAWAVAKGVTSGTTATSFSPEQSCTRGQIVTFLYRAFAN